MTNFCILWLVKDISEIKQIFVHTLYILKEKEQRERAIRQKEEEIKRLQEKIRKEQKNGKK